MKNYKVVFLKTSSAENISIRTFLNLDLENFKKTLFLNGGTLVKSGPDLNGNLNERKFLIPSPGIKTIQFEINHLNDEFNKIFLLINTDKLANGTKMFFYETNRLLFILDKISNLKHIEKGKYSLDFENIQEDVLEQPNN